MSIQPLRACIRKELLLLSRDWHGLLLLFAMPLAFILIMSLALQEQFAARAGFKLPILAFDHDQSAGSRALVKAIESSGAFTVKISDAPSHAPDINSIVRNGRFAFAIEINPAFGNRLANSTGTQDSLVDIYVAPDTAKQTEAIFLALVREALGRQWTQVLIGTAVSMSPEFAASLPKDANWLEHGIHVRHAYANTNEDIVPSAVQQSVPAWLVFAAFFVVVPLSNTLIRERQQGTLSRLRSTNLGTGTLLLGKLVPYFCINQLQVGLMLLAGHYLVPLLGGDQLQIGGSFSLLALMAATLSVAALGLALLIAVISTTTEQATLLGGTGNIILAALGGIMVPRFVMPPAMQAFSKLSPMSWGLDGFLNVLLRGTDLNGVAPYAGALASFGIIAMALAWWVQRRRE
jgi:ABC-2 type transport system permease protein